jgi:hypothetical protein
MEEKRRAEDVKYAELTLRIDVVEAKIDHNTALTQELFDLMRLGRMVQSAVKWLAGVAVAIAAIWHEWPKH